MLFAAPFFIFKTNLSFNTSCNTSEKEEISINVLFLIEIDCQDFQQFQSTFLPPLHIDLERKLDMNWPIIV